MFVLRLRIFALLAQVDCVMMQLVPKFKELTTGALGSQEGLRAAWYIRALAVHPDRQRHGIGRQLMQTVLQKVRHGIQAYNLYILDESYRQIIQADSVSRKTCLEVNSDSMVRGCSCNSTYRLNKSTINCL